jgi:hypothetical protein
LRQRQLALDRGDVNHHAKTLFNHRRQQCAIQPNGGHEILVELGAIAKRCKSSGWRSRAADDIDQDIDAAELLPDSLCNGGAAVGGRDVGRDVMDTVDWRRGRSAGCRGDPCTGIAERRDDGRTNALRLYRSSFSLARKHFDCLKCARGKRQLIPVPVQIDVMI